MKRVDPASLLYVGEGQIHERVKAHRAKARRPGHPQQTFFAGPLEVSWAVNAGWNDRLRLELENDLIAAHVLHCDAAPSALFLGQGVVPPDCRELLKDCPPHRH
jgi:hypothetical protein